MADVIITVRIMPESPEINLDSIQEEISSKIAEHGGEVGKSTTVPIAFGIKALEVVFVLDESSGNTDAMEAELAKLTGVESVEVTDVRRAIG